MGRSVGAARANRVDRAVSNAEHLRRRRRRSVYARRRRPGEHGQCAEGHVRSHATSCKRKRRLGRQTAANQPWPLVNRAGRVGRDTSREEATRRGWVYGRRVSHVWRWRASRWRVMACLGEGVEERVEVRVARTLMRDARAHYPRVGRPLDAGPYLRLHHGDKIVQARILRTRHARRDV
jgi:hypothetical protein